MKFSSYQQDIFKFIGESDENLMIQAYAGSGKTFTIVNSLKFNNANRILMTAFNKHIAKELQSKVDVDVSTLHSFGWSCVKQAYRRPRLNKWKNTDILRHVLGDVEAKIFYSYLGPIKRVMSLRKATLDTLTTEQILEQWAIDVKDDLDLGVFEQVWELSKTDRFNFDFDDMIFFPVYYNLNIPKYDCVYVDEAQDFNTAQMQLAYRAADRMIAVGDRNQAIYGFAGANPSSMDHMADLIKPTIMTLPVCYRCSDSVLDEARMIVPGILNGTGRTGNVMTVKEIKPEPGDFVLCRTTAPLVQKCLKFITDGVKATVRGRDIGQDLKKLIGKIGGETTRDLLVNAKEWLDNELQRLGPNRESIAQMKEDQHDSIVALSDSCVYTEEVIRRIDDVFSDDIEGIVFATAHRSKGLEANNIHIIRPDLMPFPKAKLEWQKTQELNLKYVAITRAKENLYYESR